jgi:hypothetical protein
MKPEEKVEVAVDMVDLVTSITADSEREKNPRISEEALISRLRRRFHKELRFPSE